MLWKIARKNLQLDSPHKLTLDNSLTKGRLRSQQRLR